MDHKIEGRSVPAAPDWWQASDGLWYPPSAHPGNQQANWPGQPTAAPPARKKANPLVIILAVIGLIFILGLAGCAAAGVFTAFAVGNAIDEASVNFDEITEGIENMEGLEDLDGIEGLEGIDGEGGIGGLLGEATEFAACAETLSNIENTDVDGQLDLIDKAIEHCATISILEVGLAEQTELLEDGQTIRELVEERCTRPDSPLSAARICEEIRASG